MAVTVVGRERSVKLEQFKKEYMLVDVAVPSMWIPANFVQPEKAPYPIDVASVMLTSSKVAGSQYSPPPCDEFCMVLTAPA